MAKTRRKKINRSPGKPYRNAKAFLADKGASVTTMGQRGRTEVLRIWDAAGGRQSIRKVPVVPQIAAKTVGDRKPKTIFVGRQYTGVARSKVYPYAGKKRGGTDKPIPRGLMARAAKAVRAVKRVVVKDGARA